MDSVLYQIGKDIGRLEKDAETIATVLGQRIGALEQLAGKQAADDQQAEREDIGKKLAELEELKRRLVEIGGAEARD